MSEGIDIQWERKNGALVASLVGRVDGSNADEFQRLLEAGIEPADATLILDFAHLSFISSAGLRVGLIIARKFNKPGKQFGICTVPAAARRVITISGFDQMITVYESRAAALSATTGESSGDGDDQERRTEEKIATMRSPIDLDIVGSNVEEMADFTIEKYEFRNNTTLSAEMREAGTAKIKDVLWKRIELLRQRRDQIRKGMFDAAEEALAEVVDKKS